MNGLPPRFWAKVNKTDTCWLWTASTNEHGYGRFSWEGAPRLAHRVAYSVLVGPIPDGGEVDHTCYEPLCVNPSHLQAVTHKQNQENRESVRRDSASGVRGVWWNPKRQRYYAYAIHNKVKHGAGHHRDLESAAKAARDKRNELHSNNLTDRRAA